MKTAQRDMRSEAFSRMAFDAQQLKNNPIHDDTKSMHTTECCECFLLFYMFVRCFHIARRRLLFSISIFLFCACLLVSALVLDDVWLSFATTFLFMIFKSNNVMLIQTNDQHLLLLLLLFSCD